ncbi:uncharacterized protein involved in exopolysaccharide biosynthesis [Rhodoligotrophos appendicifer]|uniref:GumC family protein n=1 Tax=Rhodoligotrophos appendicifer TaxID=987056 RepID=UPI001185D2E1|nr:exopolysaccharide transport family protein [Rhodoligotrophos appendicifer]
MTKTSLSPYSQEILSGSTDQPLVAAVDLFGLLQGMWRRKLLMLLITASVVGLAAFYVSKATPRYKADAEVLIGNGESAFTRSSLDNQPALMDERDIASQVQVLRSGAIAQRVIEALDLSSKPEFQLTEADLSAPEKWLIEQGLLDNPLNLDPERRTLEAYNQALQVYPVKETKVISIAFTAKDPEVAAAVANEVAQQYLASTQETQSATTGRATEWLNGQIEQLREKVVESEKAVEEYRTRAGLLQGSRSALSAESLTELNTQIIQAKAQRSETQARADAIHTMLKNGGSLSSSADVLNSPLMQRLVEREVTLRGTRDDLLTTYLPSHPRIVSINSEISGLQQQIRQEAMKIAASQEQQAQIAKAREEALSRSLDEMKTQAAGANLDEVKLRALEREATANRTLLESFLNRYSEASSRESVQAQPAMARLISTADVPLEPASPRKVPILALAVFGGMMLAAVVAFVAEIFSLDIHRVRTHQSSAPGLPLRYTDRERLSGATLGPVPLLRGPRAVSLSPSFITAAGKPVDTAKALAPTILGWRKASGIRRVLLGTDAPSPVSTETIIEIGRALARSQDRVLLIDIDQESGALADALKIEVAPGLSELLAGRASFAESIRSDAKSNLHILRGGAERNALAELSGEGRLDFVLDTLGQAYDMILLSAGGIGVDDPVPATKAGGAAVLTGLADRSRAAEIGDYLSRMGVIELLVVEMPAGSNSKGKASSPKVAA